MDSGPTFWPIVSITSVSPSKRPHGLALPRGHRVRRMGHVQAHMADLVITEVEQDDFILLLNQLHAELNTQSKRGWFGPALVMGIGQHSPAQLHLANLLDGRCRLRP